MAIASREFLRIDAEMLLITHIHQPIVAPPAIRVDDAIERATWPQITARSGFLEASGTISARPFPVPF